MSICVEMNSDETLERLEELLELVREKARADTPSSDVGEYEEQVIEVVHRIGARLMARELRRHEIDEKEVLIDGMPHTRAVRGTGTYMTVFGSVRVSRGLYRSVRNGPTTSPLERKVGIVEGF